MNTATRLAGFGTGLAVLFAAALGAGRLAGPVAGAEQSPTGHGADAGHATGAGHDEQAGHAPGMRMSSAAVPAGLQVTEDGYTLVPETTTVTPGRRSDFRFTITGPDGRPVTRFALLHGKKLHFIVARRDLSGFQHLHPVEAGGGVWSVPLTLPRAGVYRVFTDVRPEGAARQLTLGADLSAPGDYRPEALPEPGRVARVGPYTVRLTGDLRPGDPARLTFTVSKDGRPVTDLQPYLEAYAHLVTLRAGDLGYLHAHPDGAPGDGRTRPGPDATFQVEAPSAGRYRLYLDFQHENTVRTAEFTVNASDHAH